MRTQVITVMTAVVAAGVLGLHIFGVRNQSSRRPVDNVNLNNGSCHTVLCLLEKTIHINVVQNNDSGIRGTIHNVTGSDGSSLSLSTTTFLIHLNRLVILRMLSER